MIISRSPAETFQFGKERGGAVKSGDIFALWGDLGAGKTQFVKGLAAGMNIRVNVTSPTFTLIHEYPGGTLPLYHLDFYRLQTAVEALKIGLEEYLEAGGVIVIEWADKFAELIPGGAEWIHFCHVEPESREIRVGEKP